MAEAEREAVAALQCGDVAGLGTLVRLHQVRALRTAYAITGDQTSAEDVVADSFVLAYEHIAQFDPTRPFAPWFYRIVANRALSDARQNRRVLTGDAAEALLATQADPASGPEEEALHDELRSLVVLAIKELLPAQRAALVQRYYLDLDEATMARMANCPQGTIKSRLHTARTKLRERLAVLHPTDASDRSTDRRTLQRLLVRYLEEAVSSDRTVWAAVQQRVQLTLSEDRYAISITSVPLPPDVTPPPPPDFTDPHPEGVYLLTGPPRDGPAISLDEAECLANFPILQYPGPEWQLGRTAYSPAEPRLAAGFDPPRFAWRLPAVILTYGHRTHAATVIEHLNPGLGHRIRYIQSSKVLPDGCAQRVEQIGGGAYLVRYRPSDGLVTEVQFGTPTTRIFVQFDPPCAWATAAAFVQRLRPDARSMAMELTRRTFLSTASGLAALTVSGCSVPALSRLPATGTAGPLARVAGVRLGGMSNSEIRRLSDVLSQTVATLATKGPPIDPQVIWLTPPDTAPGAEGQTPTAGIVDVLDQLRQANGTTPRPDLVAVAGSLAERSAGNAILLGPDAVAQQLVNRKLLHSLDDFLRTTSLVNLDDYFPGALDACRVGGMLYGLPLSITPTMLLYDMQLFAEADVTVPAGGWDWQQLLDAALKLTKPPQQYAFAPTSLSIGMFVQQNGGAILSNDGRQCLLDQPAALEAAAFYASLFQPGGIAAPRSEASISFAQGVVTYQNANIAMLPNFGSVSPPVPPNAPRRLAIAEPFHGKVQTAGLGLQGMLVMTSAAADPASDFEAMVSLATAMQPQFFVPATLSAAKVAAPGQQGLPLDADEQAAILRTARYATYGRFAGGPNVLSALQALDAALQTGQDPASMCRETARKINALLAKQH